MSGSSLALAKLIDHALLHPTLTDEEIRKGCAIAARLGVATVCVKPYVIPLAVEVLQGSGVGVGTVIGFPHGSNTISVKAFEAEEACRAGAVELDMVVNIGKVLAQDWEYVRQDIEAVLRVARRHGAILKVIFETDLVTRTEDKRALCRICGELGVDFVKTSTGFGFVKRKEGGYDYVGATPEDVRLMREASPATVQVKASGGIRNHADAVAMRGWGATRLGTSASETILAGEAASQEGY